MMKRFLSLTALALIMGAVPALAADHFYDTAGAAWRVSRCVECGQDAAGWKPRSVGWRR